MIEAIVTFSLIGMGLMVWAAAHLARKFYRQQRRDGTSPGDTSFLATLFSDGIPGPGGDAPPSHHDSGQGHGGDGGHHGGDIGGGHH